MDPAEIATLHEPGQLNAEFGYREYKAELSYPVYNSRQREQISELDKDLTKALDAEDHEQLGVITAKLEAIEPDRHQTLKLNVKDCIDEINGKTDEEFTDYIYRYMATIFPGSYEDPRLNALLAKQEADPSYEVTLVIAHGAVYTEWDPEVTDYKPAVWEYYSEADGEWRLVPNLLTHLSGNSDSVILTVCNPYCIPIESSPVDVYYNFGKTGFGPGRSFNTQFCSASVTTLQ